MNRDLYITITQKRAKEIKHLVGGLCVVMTLDELILQEFEKNNFASVINTFLGSSIIYKIIQDNHIEYFDYFRCDSDGLGVIYSFLVKCARNNISFDSLLNGKKLEAIQIINIKYQEYKKNHKLVDISDIENLVFLQWDKNFRYKFNKIYVDNFMVGDINFIKSKQQDNILKILLKSSQVIPLISSEVMALALPKTNIIKPSIEVFDRVDEARTAVKIIRKLMEDGVTSNDILLVADNIREYNEFYKMLCDEYQISGYSSVGLSLTSYFSGENQEVKEVFNRYSSKIKSIDKLYKKLDLELSNKIKQNIKSSFKISDKKIGIELCELSDLVGSEHKYNHIIFIGGDINRFPRSGSDNFLWSYDEDLQYFYANNYFTSAKTGLDELKRLTDNLYIVTANYSGKRELMPSILLDNKFDYNIDISEINSPNQLSLKNKTVISDENIKEYYKSILSQDLTKFDGIGVSGFKEITLSASQINKYISCPLAYLYSNRLKIQAPTETQEGFDVMEQGSLMHLCYELFGKRIRDRKITHIDLDRLFELMYQVSEDAYKIFSKKSDTVEKTIHHRLFFNTLQSGLKDNNKYGLLAKFVNYYIEKASELNYFQDSKFEYQFALDKNLNACGINSDDIFIKGVIDRVDILKSVVNVIDYKSKKMISNLDSEKIKQIRELKDVQLALYILYVKQQFTDKNYYASLLSFKGDKPYYHFANLSNENIKDYELYSDKYEEELKNLIFTTRDNIQNGKFGFNDSDDKVCGYCDFQNICHTSILNKSTLSLNSNA
jgi:RecB family exonuclease/uncharacterized protein YoaH (UPF0181 family)